MSDTAKLHKGDFLATRTISHVQRAGISADANPVYRVFFTDGLSALTKADAPVGYRVQDPDVHGIPLSVQFTRSGRIRSATVISTGRAV